MSSFPTKEKGKKECRGRKSHCRFVKVKEQFPRLIRGQVLCRFLPLTQQSEKDSGLNSFLFFSLFSVAARRKCQNISFSLFFSFSSAKIPGKFPGNNDACGRGETTISKMKIESYDLTQKKTGKYPSLPLFLCENISPPSFHLFISQVHLS